MRRTRWHFGHPARVRMIERRKPSHVQYMDVGAFVSEATYRQWLVETSIMRPLMLPAPLLHGRSITFPTLPIA